MHTMPLSRLLMPALFLLLAGPVLPFLAAWVPTGESPDEVAHVIRMDSVRHGALIGHRTQRVDSEGNSKLDSGVLAEYALLPAGFAFNPRLQSDRVMNQTRWAYLGSLTWENETKFVSIPNTGVYPPFFYVPGAIALQVAKSLGRNPWRAIIWARFANAATYLLLGTTALLLARRGQGLLFAAVSLPMSLWLAASCNQDGVVIGTAALAAALLTRGTVAAWWGAVAAVALIVMAKPLYLPLAGAVAVMAPVGGLRPGLRLAGLIGSAVPGVAWYALAQSRAVVPFWRMTFVPGPNWPGEPGQIMTLIDPALQLQVLLHNPALLLTLPFDTILNGDDRLEQSMVGILGLLDIYLPAWAYTLWLVALGAALAAACLGERVRGYRPGSLAWCGVLACLAATVFALFAGQYLSWTRTGWALVEGMQGRYFIPLLPFLVLATPFVHAPGWAGPRWLLRLPALAAALWGLVALPGLVVANYYLH